MNDWFEWNGVKCTDYGMHVLTPPSIIVAKERVEDIQIPGKSGTLTRREGNLIYDNKNLSATCIIDDIYDEDGNDIIAKIAGWLRGNGEVKFWNRPEGIFKARIANQIPFDKILRNHPHRLFNVEFQCDPYLYLWQGDLGFEVTSTWSIQNLGNVPSAPLLKTRGNGEGTIMIGNQTMLLDIPNDVGELIIDCDAKIAYSGTPGDPNNPLILRGNCITGEWLEIPEGNSMMTISGDLVSVTVFPRWRCV